MNRRNFLRGVSVMALAAKLNFSQPEYTNVTYGTETPGLPDEVRKKYVLALARSIQMSREQMTARILNNAFTKPLAGGL